MRLEKKLEEELAKRRGATGRTIVQLIWLIISFVIAYFLINYLFEQEAITYGMIYRVGIPKSVPEWAILLTLMFVVVVAMQFFLFIGYAFANPEGRRRTGDPTLRSSVKDPYDERNY